MWVSAALPLGVRHMLQQSCRWSKRKTPTHQRPDRKGGFNDSMQCSDCIKLLQVAAAQRGSTVSAHNMLV